MFRPDDTRRAHTMARAMRPAFTSYREAYALACRHVAASRRTTTAACPTRPAASAWCYAASAVITLCTWLAMPAVAAAAQ